MTLSVQDAPSLLEDAGRNLEQGSIEDALSNATHAYVLFQHASDAGAMAEAVRLVVHGYCSQGLYRKAEQMAQEELAKFRKLGSRWAEATMLLTLAEANLHDQDFKKREEAVQLGSQARLAFSALKEPRALKFEAESLLAVGNAYLKLVDDGRKFKLAREAFDGAFDIFQSHLRNEKRLEGRALHGLAVVEALFSKHGSNSSFAPALKLAQAALELFRQVGSRRDEIFELECLAAWSLEAGNLQMALPFAEEGLQLSRGAHCKRLEASAARTLARVLVALGRISSAIDLLNDAKDLFRQTDARQAESVVLATLAEILALQGDVEEALNIGEAALQVAQELGDLRQEVLMLCSISELSLLSRRDAKQASLAAARAALAILRELLPAERGLRARVLGCLSNAELESPTLGLQGALQSLEQERDHCRSRGDLPGQALAVTSAAALNFEFGLHQDALASAEEARALFKAAGDRLGEASALHLSAEVEAKEGHHANTLQAAQKAQALLEAVGDEPEGQASLQLLIAHAQLCLLQNAHHDPRSSSFRQAAEQATQSATRAVMLARKGNETRLVGSALCVLSQAEQLLAREGISSDACYRAANSAAAIFHQLRDQHGEASALLLCANAHIASGKLIPAKQAASKALLLFRELGDSTGKAKVEAALDAIENPTSPLESARSLPGTLQPVTTRISRAPDPEVFRQKVRKVVAEIVGMDDLEDETPLMQAGLTSQSAVLLRNALGKALPGSSLPFTMMFDFPSIAALHDYFVERAAPEEEEVFMHPEAATVQKEQGPDPEVLKRKVQAVVAKIVGMDDLEDDAPLMNSGLTSQSAVLLRNALSKELPGSSLPFTMMFDFPSVAALTEYFVERAAPDVGPSATAASHAHAQPELRQVPAAQDSSGKDALRAEQVLTKVRKVVSDIVGLDELEDDSPLMNSGLTSQHAVLLRQALSKGFGGSRLPHTMMFDFPSISDLTDFLLEQNLQ